MTEFKRVRESGWEYTIPARRVADGVEVLDKPALAPSGKPITPKPVTPLGTPAPGSRQERKRGNQTSEANVLGEDAGQSAAPDKEN